MTVVKPTPTSPVPAFKATNWSQSELITQEKANVINKNIDYLFNNTPRAVWTIPGGGRDIRRTEGVKIASGRIIIASPASNSATGEVRFGNFFSTGCEPNVTTGILASFPGVVCAISGIGGSIPDQRGIVAKVEIADWMRATRSTFGETIYINFNAMGY